MVTSPSLRIGTRGSPLALAQAEEVRRRLAAAWPDLAAPEAVVIVPIKTTGDRIQDRTLADAGGKGLFTKEIEEALIAGELDLAVHSMKDVPTWLPDGLIIPCLLPREDPRDALIVGPTAAGAKRLSGLPHAARIGTSALRRRAQLLAHRGDLVVVNFRGNVGTRLRKIEAGEVHATILALAGLRRLGLADRAAAILDPIDMLPAVAQGAIGIECRADDKRVRGYLARLHDEATGIAIAAERGVLERLDGSCRTPIAALATVSKGRVALDALVARPDGSEVLKTSREGPVGDAAALGCDAGDELRRSIGPNFFAMTGGE
ncbi:MAG: hydroxymethylbilane synthase [Rhodospirillales bacterium]|nr:hydroxymethylbilane synthase [Rhodospirillales bacterium]